MVADINLKGKGEETRSCGWEGLKHHTQGLHPPMYVASS